jgi:hypothetical protein
LAQDINNLPTSDVILVHLPDLLQKTLSALSPLAGPFASGVVRSFIRSQSGSVPATVSAPVVMPTRLGPSAQWARIVAVAERSIDCGQRAVEYHMAARSHLDASDYELRRLREDLGAALQRRTGVLTLVSARRPTTAEPRQVALAA